MKIAVNDWGDGDRKVYVSLEVMPLLTRKARVPVNAIVN